MSYQKIIDGNCEILFGKELWSQLSLVLTKISPSQIFVLTDGNTEQDCLPYFDENFSRKWTYKHISIPFGEKNKTLTTCHQVWNELSEAGADRKSILINLGGGVVCDLGGFVASTYMRGISWINIPTTLLSMVDASVGGKTGVDFNGIKNLIGIIRNPLMVGIDSTFLQTLNLRERKSGFAEMLKHALLSNKEHWEALQSIDLEKLQDIDKYIYKSIQIKHAVVSKDRNETGLRKQLNFGHTIGHAIESYYLNNENPILHGEAIAVGMLIELYLSVTLLKCPESILERYTKMILKTYSKLPIQDSDIDKIIKILAFDKKNEKGKINFVLLHNFGKPEIDCQVSNSAIQQAIRYYKKV